MLDLRCIVTESSGTFGLVVSREANRLVQLRVSFVRLKNKGEPVAGRRDRLVAGVMSISRVFLAAEPPQDLLVVQNLEQQGKEHGKEHPQVD